MKCQHCGENVDLPFKCPFCGGYFCPDHRLPENHACAELETVRTRKPPPPEDYYRVAAEIRPEPFRREPPLRYPLRFKKAGLTSASEVLHLTAGALMVMAIGLSLKGPIDEQIFKMFRQPTITLSSALIFTLIFVEAYDWVSGRWSFVDVQWMAEEGTTDDGDHEFEHIASATQRFVREADGRILIRMWNLGFPGTGGLSSGGGASDFRSKIDFVNLTLSEEFGEPLP